MENTRIYEQVLLLRLAAVSRRAAVEGMGQALDMTAQETYDYANLTEQIKANASITSAMEGNSRYSLMLVISSVTWLLLSCISAFIYCCNFWELFTSVEGEDESVESDDSLESQLEQQSMLLSQVSEVSST